LPKIKIKARGLVLKENASLQTRTRSNPKRSFEEKQLDDNKNTFEKKNNLINVVVKPSKNSTGNYGFDDIGFLTPEKSLSIEKE